MSKLIQLSALVLLMGSAAATLDAVHDDQDLLCVGVPQKLTVRLQPVPREEQNTKVTEASAILTPKTSLDEAQERMEAENQKLKEITAQLEEHRKKEAMLKLIAAAEELLAEKRALAEMEAQKVAPQVVIVQSIAPDLSVPISKLEGKVNKQVGRFFGHLQKGKF